MLDFNVKAHLFKTYWYSELQILFESNFKSQSYTFCSKEKNADFSKEVVKKFVLGFYNFRVIEKFKMLRTVEPLYLLYYSAYSWHCTLIFY